MLFVWKLVILIGISTPLSVATCEIENCKDCTDPPLQCYGCPGRQTLAADNSGCVNCPDNCSQCRVSSKNRMICDRCDVGYVMEANTTCTWCGEGCSACQYDSGGRLVCGDCEVGYVVDETYAERKCQACGPHCRVCEMRIDGSTVCLRCEGKVGNNTHAYYTNRFDGLCYPCPDDCAECIDVGIMQGLCRRCGPGYVLLEDKLDSSNDGTECIKCPDGCDTCSGIRNGTHATCMSCKEHLGLFLKDGNCKYCGDDQYNACKICDEEGKCVECADGYKLEVAVCEPCQTFCASCVGGEDSCRRCQQGYGVKPAGKGTCDRCPQNCNSCYLNMEKIVTCSACEDGYAKDDTGECIPCAESCKQCRWLVAGYMTCDVCLPGYTDTPLTDDGAAESKDNVAQCMRCPEHCNACPDSFNCRDTASCHAEFVAVIGADGNKTCEKITDNCEIPTDDNTIGCSTCSPGFYVSNSVCRACSSGCNSCDITACLSCKAGYRFVDSDGDGTDDTCKKCNIRGCSTCVMNAASEKCETCDQGYALYDTDSDVTNGYESCKECPSACTKCSVDYNDNDDTKCDSDGCVTWDADKSYVHDSVGACQLCPKNCKQCTWDGIKSICMDSFCIAGYAKDATSGDCKPCPSKCTSCQWDVGLAQTVCKIGHCDPDFGVTDGKCSPCPRGYSTCEFDETEEGGFVGVTCKNGFYKNEGVCGICPENCSRCAYVSGKMSCEQCDEGFILSQQDKTCTKCPSRCTSCFIGQQAVYCSRCEEGFVVSDDMRQCISCQAAAFSFCAVCGPLNSTTLTAPCSSCREGYVLKDDSSECLSTGHLQCSGQAEDRKPICTTCELTYKPAPDKHTCVRSCYKCGDIESFTWVQQSSCKIGANATGLERCDSGACWGWYREEGGVGLVMAGCRADELEPCEGTALLGEQCEGDTCKQCCVGNTCNEFVVKMSGVQYSGAALTRARVEGVISMIVAFLFVLSGDFLSIC